MRHPFGLLGAGLLSLAAAALLGGGCQAPPKNVNVSAIRVMVFDETGRAPADIPQGLRSEIPNMAAQTGLIGRQVGDPGERILLQGRITQFPTLGRDATQSPWINSGPITIEYTVSKEDGEELGSTSITTDPADSSDARMCPFVFGQSQAVIRWLSGR